MKNTYRLISITFLILFHLFSGAASAETRHVSKPNIIFIMADDLGKNILSLSHIKNIIKMPNLERLAEEGVEFKNAYATPVCFPTRVKLMSGRYSLNTGAYINEPVHFGRYKHRSKPVVKVEGRNTGFYKHFYKTNFRFPLIDPQYTPSFVQPLKQGDYTTAFVGKWHLNDYIKQARIYRTFGFDQWMMSSRHTGLGASTDKGSVITPGYHPEKLADFVVNFITENKDKPFFVYYPMHLVHHPVVATPLNPDADTIEEKMISMIEYVDLIIGRLMKTLETLKLRDRTIIFFSGDNGDDNKYRILYKFIKGTRASENQPFRGKGSLYEGGVNVPLIVSGGPVMQRGETEALVDFTDILPTLADFAGVPVVRQNREDDDDYRGIADEYISVGGQYKGDGYSIMPFLTGQTEDTPRTWIMFAGVNDIVIRDKRFKLWATVEDQLYRGYQFYDLYNDRYELNNLYESRDPTILAAKRRLEDILNKVPGPTSIDEYYDPVDWNYGMLAHWTMDQSNLGDTEGGYDAESNTDVVFKKQGKFGEAIEANRLQSFYSEGLFYNFIIGDTARLLHKITKTGLFYEGVKSLIRMNKTLVEYTNIIYNWISPDPYSSPRGDREKFRSSMTMSVWVQTPRPEQDIYLLKQPYVDKEGNLISLSITEDATVNFELTTNDKTHSLESKVLDQSLWGQWQHIVATWDGREDCGEAILYVNGERVAQACLGKPLSADDTGNLLLGGFAEDSTANNPATLVDDIAIWRQPLMPMQVEALYKLGNRFSYNASEVDTLFNTPEEDGVTKIGDQVWHRAELGDISDTDRLIILERPDGVKVQFGEVLAIEARKPLYSDRFSRF